MQAAAYTDPTPMRMSYPAACPSVRRVQTRRRQSEWDADGREWAYAVCLWGGIEPGALPASTHQQHCDSVQAVGLHTARQARVQAKQYATGRGGVALGSRTCARLALVPSAAETDRFAAKHWAGRRSAEWTMMEASLPFAGDRIAGLARRLVDMGRRYRRASTDPSVLSQLCQMLLVPSIEMKAG